MATDLQEAAAALAEGRSYAARERERRIGVTYLLSGTTVVLVFATYGALQLTGVSHQLVYSLAWAPFIVLASYVRRRFFRFLPTSSQQMWGLPQGLWFLFVALFVLTPLTLGTLGVGHAAWPAEGLLMAAMYATQAARGRDRMHALFALFVALVALATIAIPPGYQALTLGVAIGTTLVGLGLVRLRRAHGA